MIIYIYILIIILSKSIAVSNFIYLISKQIYSNTRTLFVETNVLYIKDYLFNYYLDIINFNKLIHYRNNMTIIYNGVAFVFKRNVYSFMLTRLN